MKGKQAIKRATEKAVAQPEQERPIEPAPATRDEHAGRRIDEIVERHRATLDCLARD